MRRCAVEEGVIQTLVESARQLENGGRALNLICQICEGDPVNTDVTLRCGVPSNLNRDVVECG